MNKKLLFAGFICAISANAQFVFNKNYSYKNGDRMNAYTFFDSLDLGKPGINNVWDFSEVSLNEPFTPISYVNHTPNSVFSKSTIKTVQDGTTVYYKTDDAGLSCEGVLIENEEKTYNSTLYHTPIQQYWTYPVEFNKLQSFDFAGKTTTSTSSIPFLRKGNTTSIIDAAGKLTIPTKKVYNNVIRLKTVQSIVDSSDTGMMLTKYDNNTTTYTFYAENNYLPIFAISTIKRITKVYYFGSLYANDTTITYSNLYYEPVTTDLKESVFSQISKIYPNPIQANSEFTLEKSINSVEFYNLSGKLVYTFDSKSENKILPLEKGVYFTKSIDYNNTEFRSKLIVN